MNLAGYAPLKPNIIFLWLPHWPQPIVEYGSSIQGRSQDGAKIEDFKYLSKGKLFLVQCNFRVQRGANKKILRKKKKKIRKKKERKRKKVSIKKKMRKEKIWVCVKIK
jgi:hypothetical protein